MISKILIGLAVLVVVFVIVAALQPSTFRVARTTLISAPSAIAFGQVNDLHKWQEISPYVKLDSAAKYTFEGPSAGTGAVLAWAGNHQIGEGRLTIVESRPNELIRMRLDFAKPFASTSVAEFTFETKGSQTAVTWSLAGPKNFVCKAIGLVMNMDKMMGDQFEEGLGNLKTIAETSVRKQPIASSPQLIHAGSE
jgi:hypothetical protein